MSNPTPLRPLCFVVMPFGRKPRSDGGPDVDFDAVYDQLIEPAIVAANMEPLRADAERLGGIIHKPMFERLILSEYVVADLTTANANVFYELGVRHAVRPHTTLLLAAHGGRLPFDVAMARAQLYSLDGAVPSDVEADAARLSDALRAARDAEVDSPVFQLVEGFGPPNIERLRTDAFRDRVAYSERLRGQLRAARGDADAHRALAAVREELGAIEDVELGIAVDLLLSYRDLGDHQAMVDLVGDLPKVAQRTVLVREQLGFALNRLKRHDEAVTVLEGLLAERGPSSETFGLLGRVHKDRWSEAADSGRTIEAQGHLDKAIRCYLEGFEADWRDAYPGINALTLLTLRDSSDPLVAEIGPVVVYSAKRRAQSSDADYWDHATLLEAAVLAGDQDAAIRSLQVALTLVEASWQPETTLNNLSRILETWTTTGTVLPWHETIRAELEVAADR